MTLRAFALATRARTEMADSTAELNRKTDIAELFSDAIRARGRKRYFRLHGAGLFYEDGLLYPTVLADRSQNPSSSQGLIPIRVFPDLRDTLIDVLDGFWADDFDNYLRVMLTTASFLHAAPGSEIVETATGRVGPHVTWGSGRTGFLTAGHVAQSIGGTVDDLAGNQVGTVRWSNDPAQAPSTTADVDVALVEFDPPQSAITGQTARTAGAGEVVDVAGTGQQSTVFAFMGSVLMGSAQANYANCYATQNLVTQPGDSGALVESTGDVVGMVIGGFSQRDMTIVQAIDYQITEIRNLTTYMISL